MLALEVPRFLTTSRLPNIPPSSPGIRVATLKDKERLYRRLSLVSGTQDPLTVSWRIVKRQLMKNYEDLNIGVAVVQHARNNFRQSDEFEAENAQ